MNSAYFLLPPPSLSIKYLLAILNSKVIQFYLSLIAETSGMGTTRWINQYVKKFPIPDPIPEIEQQITLLVDRILSITDDAASYLDSPQKQSSVKKVEEQLDELVYKLFGLDDKEISLIEAHIEKE